MENDARQPAEDHAGNLDRLRTQLDTLRERSERVSAQGEEIRARSERLVDQSIVLIVDSMVLLDRLQRAEEAAHRGQNRAAGRGRSASSGAEPVRG